MKQFILDLISKASKLLLILSTLSFVLGIILAALPEFAAEMGITLSPEVITSITVSLGGISVAGGALSSARVGLSKIAAFNKTETQRVLLKQQQENDERDIRIKNELKNQEIRHQEELNLIRQRNEQEIKVMNKEILERFNVLLQAQIINAERNIRLGISTQEEKEQFAQFVKDASAKLESIPEPVMRSIKDIVNRL